MSVYWTPTDLREALDLLASHRLTVVAGGTDFYPARVGKPLTESVLDIVGLEELRGISTDNGAFRIGAMTTWAQIVRSELPPEFEGLRLAAGEVGAVQVQNAATVGGNLCNASPAADGVPPLLTLNASVELTSVAGSRVLPLEEFITGYRQTALRPDELLTAVLVHRADVAARSTFLKLGSRRYLVISIAMVAALIALGDDGNVAEARVAVGACSPVATRLRGLEGDLAGRVADDDLAAVVTRDHLAPLSPIGDVRATAEYRRDAALTLVRRALTKCTTP